MPIRLTDLRSDKEITDLTDPRYLKLDQTTPQIVSSGAPKFGVGIIIAVNQKLVLDGTT